jgi:hypothetical protein
MVVSEPEQSHGLSGPPRLKAELLAEIAQVTEVTKNDHRTGNNDD